MYKPYTRTVIYAIPCILTETIVSVYLGLKMERIAYKPVEILKKPLIA
jgi:hypothetical protein